MTEGRHAVLSELGETPMDGLDRHLAVVPMERPEPGPGEARVRVRRAHVNWVDLLMLSGQYQHVPEVPYTPGMEWAGEVEAVGPGVDAVEVGQAVIADGFATGPRSLGAHRRWGGFATWALAPADALIAKPSRLSFDQACALLGAYETAYHCLHHRGRLAAGETILIHGASGTTGLASVHLAKRAGATVIATGRGGPKLDAVRAEGADHVIAVAANGGGVRRFRDEVKELTGGRGVDVVFDPVGGDISLESLRCVRFGARFLIVGWAATPFVARGKGQRGAPNANVLPTNLIMMKSLDVLGCPAVISAHKDPSLRVERLRRILEWAEAGEITPRVAERFALADVHDAMRAKWKSRHVGAIVIDPA